MGRLSLKFLTFPSFISIGIVNASFGEVKNFTEMRSIFSKIIICQSEWVCKICTTIRKRFTREVAEFALKSFQILQFQQLRKYRCQTFHILNYYMQRLFYRLKILDGFGEENFINVTRNFQFCQHQKRLLLKNHIYGAKARSEGKF